jgi:hypothetical protein
MAAITNRIKFGTVRVVGRAFEDGSIEGDGRYSPLQKTPLRPHSPKSFEGRPLYGRDVSGHCSDMCGGRGGAVLVRMQAVAGNAPDH